MRDEDRQSARYLLDAGSRDAEDHLALPLRDVDDERIEINPRNFIDCIFRLKEFFADPLDAVHCFYDIVGYWDITSTVALAQSGKTIIVGRRGTRIIKDPKIKPRFHEEFKIFVESRFVFTNERSGLTVDHYFSRFDEVIQQLQPLHARQHGIFFTDSNLCRFALWFVHEFFEKQLGDKYIVLDPAGGSGNLVTSGNGHLKHKIVSELQPDLLKTIERRMSLEPEHVDGGFTIIPKTSANQGLNFLDKSAAQYVSCLMQALMEKSFAFDKPIAFLLNPPYKNTDEHEAIRDKVAASYDIHPSILELTGNDAGKERYLAFLGQIINIARLQMGDIPVTGPNFDDVHLPAPLPQNSVDKPLILIFTPTSWLIPRPTYVKFRQRFDQYFKYESGFLVRGKEFFGIPGTFPIAFTVWSYRRSEKGNKNAVVLRDLTHLRHDDLAVNWHDGNGRLRTRLRGLVRGAKRISLSAKRTSIKEWCGQQMYDFKRDPTQAEKHSGAVFGGLPIKDRRRSNKKTYGVTNSATIGGMEDGTPVRVKPRDDVRFTPDNLRSVWFRFDTAFLDMNKSRCTNLPPDQKGYAAYDLASAQKTFAWYGITKALNGRYPLWANQVDIWTPTLTASVAPHFYALCFAFGLSENQCVVTKFAKDDPVSGAPEVFVDNPLCPTNPGSFWSVTLDREITKSHPPAHELAGLVMGLYRTWNRAYCKGQVLKEVGLQIEPYFACFDDPDFLTPHSGLIQIRKYAELHSSKDLLEQFAGIAGKTKDVREEIHRLLLEELRYFG